MCGVRIIVCYIICVSIFYWLCLLNVTHLGPTVVLVADLGLVLVLHCRTLGLSLLGGPSRDVLFRQRKLGLETTGWDWDCNRGVEGLLLPMKNPSFVQLLGLGITLGLGLLCCCFSETVVVTSESRGIVVQNALLQPVPILSNTNQN